MKNNIYLMCKTLISQEAKEQKRLNPKDKPMQREVLNNLCDDLCRQIGWHEMKGTISEKQSKMYQFWLSNHTANKHPKEN